MSSGDALHRPASVAPPMPEQVEAWRQSIRRDTFANYQLEMAVALCREGSQAAAVEAFRRAIAIMPESAEAHAGLVETLEAMDQDAAAAEARRAAAALDMDLEATGCVRLGLLDLRDRRPDAMRERGRRALVLKPGHPPAEMLVWFAGMLEETPAALPAGAASPGREMASLGAEAGFLGMEWAGRSRHDLAEPLLRFSLFHEENPVRLREAAIACQIRFALDDAAGFLARACALDPVDSAAAFSLVLTDIVRGRPDAVAATLDSVAERQPDALPVVFHRCLFDLVRGRPADALERGAASPHGGRGSILALQGLALIALGEAERAEPLLRQALVVDPQMLHGLLGAAIGLHMLGRIAEAEEVRRRATAHHRGAMVPFLAAVRRWVGEETMRFLGVPEGALPGAARPA
ncbi:hypothetical protein GAY30_08285 [Azospirillum brasilense]|uniref:hypothetical protein n=1 Tax=Azospirillum brasilense TaxID=192 RepID=UPI00157B5351|nr:hypothetical protein [Azospirillum brasilense]NUB24899.1 hypothetical protein [Azospirillum brasilense]